MSEPRRWLGTEEDHGHFIPIEEVKDWHRRHWSKAVEVIEAEPVLERIKQLEAQLKEANEVAEFYGGTDCYAVVTADGQVDGFSEEEPGKRARAYLKKWEKP